MSNFFSPIIGISTGDPNGIGIEVILKSLEKINFIGKFTPVIFSNYNLIEEQKRIFNVNCEIVPINNIESLSRNSVNVLGRTLYNTNRKFLSQYDGSDGIKTGFTSSAGFNLAASAKRGNKLSLIHI